MATTDVASGNRILTANFFSQCFLKIYNLVLYPISNILFSEDRKQGPTWHRPMAHPVVFKYLSYSTKLAEHAYGGARPWAGLRHVCSFVFS